MIKITFPDGNVKEFAKGTTAYQVAESISPRLAADCLAASVNGEQVTAEQEDGYILIERKWKKSDEIVITLQPELRYEVVPGGKHYHAYF